MDLFSPIIELLKDSWDFIKLFHIVNAYEHGVLLRFGKYRKTIEEGVCWKVPFVDEVKLCRNTITTLNLNIQTLTTLDGKEVIVDAIVKFKITNPKKFLLEVHEVEDAVSDIAQAKIKEIVTALNWEELRVLKDEKIKDLAHKEILEFGIKIHYITLTSLAKTRVYRMITTN